MKVGEKIRKVRNLKGISQEYLAQKMNISQVSIAKIERDEMSLSLNKLEQIANILEVSVEEILKFDDAKIFKLNFKDNTTNSGNAYAYAYFNENFEKERQLYERMLSERDLEIEALKKQVEKLTASDGKFK